MIASTGMHPLFLLMAAVGIVTGLYTIYSIFPMSMPVLFAFSVIGLLVRIAQLSKEARREHDPGEVIDFEKLHAKDVARYGPWLKENLRGHNAVVDRALGRIQSNLAVAVPQRTLGAFLLVGPTGTGKTFFGELMAKALYPDGEVVILRMNQYKDHQDVVTLIGPPPGHMGYEIGGSITRPVLEDPYRAIVLDEFDKAHPDVRHCLYDILDRAQCREKSSGRNVHFSACVFFATCNAGVEDLRSIWGESDDPIVRTGRAREALSRQGFEKALLARFDDILLMDELKPVEVAEVACLQIAKHWRQYGIEVAYASPELLVEAVKRNVEFQEYGVRQLAHLIQELTGPLIEAARRNGVTSVRLELDPKTNRVTVAER
ncbi:MAG: ATP-dependent Clp protease ATP-binding subunit [Elusimicrobia bacterium]|nr:ATP-dependent Clp protease ATP-binding subunit [Elusimicrobiota bacterium]